MADPRRGPAAPGLRVVSLVPSVTETLLAWGIRPLAVTRFCEQPGLPTVGGTKDPDVAAIIALQPDLVVVNDEENRREDGEALARAGIALHVTSVRAVEEVEPCLRDLAAAVHATQPDTEREAFHRIDIDSMETPGPGTSGARSVFVPIWRRPWMSLNADTYGSSLLARLGLVNICAGAPERYPTVTLDEVARRRPDLVLLPSEPYPFGERHRASLEPLAETADVRLVDGRDLFWWGVRTPAALGRLRQSIGA